MDDDKEVGENVEKVVMLTTELLEKYKRVEMMKKY